ncbi:hypothetical protein ACFST9_11795 [Hymenobacter monticola]|uniref:Uncharacterized protein n=1 Tax=Hymenobacter monticola TaxID=1705399 RepID=A0ABY4BEQ5_9BACT|nr:hypothetical protein [Hymenobacter monticola]UOE35125.1 hypothetical protein MTP16_05615 [Hymenobacter monticola]
MKLKFLPIFGVRPRFGQLLLLCGLGLAAPARAQRPERVATRVDSLRAARDGAPTFFPAQFTFVSGKQVQGYVESYSTSLLDKVECYETPPDRLPRPKLKAIDIERLQSMAVDGHTLVALQLHGKPLKMLAENVATPGPLALYGYAKTKNDMLIPIPLPVGALLISTGTHEKYYWYVRAYGGELQEVPRTQQGYTAFMSRLCEKVPALAAELRPAKGTEAARRPKYQLHNAPELISAYNQAVSGK